MNRELFLPAAYRDRPAPEYYDDAADFRSETVFQPEIYPAALLLLAGTGRGRLVDVGCGSGRKLAAAAVERKLGIDFGSNIAHCRARFPDAAEWVERDLGEPVPGELVERIGADDVVVCSDVIEHLPDPRPLLAFLAACFARGALVITSTPDRVLVRGADHLGPPDNPAHVREWACAEYRALLAASGLPAVYCGLTLNNDADRLLRTIVSIHEPRLQRRFTASRQRPLAILSCYNEGDVLAEVIDHWIAQGCDVHVLDNWSTDGTAALLAAAAERYGAHVTLERFPAERPAEANWGDILARKEEIAFCHKGRWIIHTDADEIRRSPFPGFTLADSLAQVAAAGWNRVDFTVLNHRPVNDSEPLPGALATALPYFEFGNKPGHFVQKKAWLQAGERVCLTASGGHQAEFTAASDCPYHFALHHYPLRSPEHARRKIGRERLERWSAQEQAMGWHSHYAEFLGEQRLVWGREDLHDARDRLWLRHGLQILLGLRR